jgi:hypothetical protein
MQRLADVSQARALLAHERNRHVYAQDDDLFLRDPATGNVRRLSGLMPVLGAVFWPEHVGPDEPSRSEQREAAKKRDKARAKAERRITQQGAPAAERGGGGRRPQNFGTAHGKLMHRQLSAAVLVDKESFHNLYPSMLPATKAQLDFIALQGWLPLQPDVPVYDEELGICARFDLAAAKPCGTLVFIEFTSGSGDCFTSSALSMAGSLTNIVRDSDCGHKFLELAFTILIALRGHPGLHRYEAYVLRAKAPYEKDFAKKPVACYPLPPALLAVHGAAIYRDVAQYRAQCRAQPPWGRDRGH